jgi:DNA anti-recombination protein RmuC
MSDERLDRIDKRLDDLATRLDRAFTALAELMERGFARVNAMMESFTQTQMQINRELSDRDADHERRIIALERRRRRAR